MISFDKTNAAVGTIAASASLTGTLSNRQGGPGEVYTAKVTLTSTLCSNTSASTIPDAKVVPVLGVLSKIDNITCKAIGNGSAIIGTLTYPAVAVPSPYTGSHLPGQEVGTGTTSTLPNLKAGTYTLTCHSHIE